MLVAEAGAQPGNWEVWKADGRSWLEQDQESEGFRRPVAEAGAGIWGVWKAHGRGWSWVRIWGISIPFAFWLPQTPHQGCNLNTDVMPAAAQCLF